MMYLLSYFRKLTLYFPIICVSHGLASAQAAVYSCSAEYDGFVHELDISIDKSTIDYIRYFSINRDSGHDCLLEVKRNGLNSEWDDVGLYTFITTYGPKKKDSLAENKIKIEKSNSTVDISLLNSGYPIICGIKGWISPRITFDTLKNKCKLDPENYNARSVPYVTEAKDSLKKFLPKSSRINEYFTADIYKNHDHALQIASYTEPGGIIITDDDGENAVYNYYAKGQIKIQGVESRLFDKSNEVRIYFTDEYNGNKSLIQLLYHNHVVKVVEKEEGL